MCGLEVGGLGVWFRRVWLGEEGEWEGGGGETGGLVCVVFCEKGGRLGVHGCVFGLNVGHVETL